MIKHTEIEFLSSFMQIFISLYFNRQCIIKRLETCISYQTKKMLAHIYKVFVLKFLMIRDLILNFVEFRLTFPKLGTKKGLIFIWHFA